MSNNVMSIRFAAAILVTLVFVNMAGAFSGAGSGTQSNPYVITNVNQLQEMNNDLDAWYKLGNAIDASDTVNWNGGAGFLPVGSDANPFTGNFDGNGFNISGLYINNGSSNYTGLFGYSVNSTISNVYLTDESIAGADYVGGLAGYIKNFTIANISNSGVIHITVQFSHCTGGLIGFADSGRFDYLSSNIDLKFSGHSYPWTVGGLIGNFNNGEISNSYSTGDIDNFEDLRDVGGLIGATSNVSITNCFSNKSMAGNGNWWRVGGLIGTGGGTVINCTVQHYLLCLSLTGTNSLCFL